MRCNFWERLNRQTGPDGWMGIACRQSEICTQRIKHAMHPKKLLSVVQKANGINGLEPVRGLPLAGCSGRHPLQMSNIPTGGSCPSSRCRRESRAVRFFAI